MIPGFPWLLACCILLASCAPGAVGVGIGGGRHGGGGGVGVSFPVGGNYNSKDTETYAPQSSGLDYGAGYPPHNCEEPVGLAPDRDDPSILRRKYWNAVDAYRDCIQAYIIAAKRDRELVQERIDQAAREYQRFMTFGN